jgi:LPXTG-site transpeptidase (sortase) family protein
VNKDTYASTAGPDEPKYIKIDSIRAEGFIMKVGVDQRKEVGVPDNIYLGGWFTDSRKPGQSGLSIIDGHVDGASKPGIFKNLNALQKGDIIEITLGNETVKQFKVMTVTEVPADQAPSAVFSQDPHVKSQLNLITCGGKFDHTKRQYLNRIVVTSERVS